MNLTKVDRFECSDTLIVGEACQPDFRAGSASPRLKTPPGIKALKRRNTPTVGEARLPLFRQTMRSPRLKPHPQDSKP
ncbi:MAG: hypothetical protein AB9834_13840 [Lentimicrobium sp.]